MDTASHQFSQTFEPKIPIFFPSFLMLPAELRRIIWEFTTYQSLRYIELYITNLGHPHIRNTRELQKSLPESLWACFESWTWLRPRYPLLDLGPVPHDEGNTRDGLPNEFWWMPPANLDLRYSGRQIHFDPDRDTVALVAGSGLLAASAFLESFAQRQAHARIKHLVTGAFLWDGRLLFATFRRMVLEAFPLLKTIHVVGQRNDECHCGYCHQSLEADYLPEVVKLEVTRSIKEQTSKEDKPVPAIFPVDIYRSSRTNIGSLHAKPWYENVKRSLLVAEREQRPSNKHPPIFEFRSNRKNEDEQHASDGLLPLSEKIKIMREKGHGRSRRRFPVYPQARRESAEKKREKSKAKQDRLRTNRARRRAEKRMLRDAWLMTPATSSNQPPNDRYFLRKRS